jgi:hypothetical protein
MSTPIINLIKAHPVNNRDNLLKICQKCDISIKSDKPTEKPSKGQIISAIEDSMIQNPLLEATVRTTALEIKAEANKLRPQPVTESMESESTPTPVTDFTPSFSQNSQIPLFEDTQEPPRRKRTASDENGEETEQKKQKKTETTDTMVQQLIDTVNAERKESKARELSSLTNLNKNEICAKHINKTLIKKLMTLIKFFPDFQKRSMKRTSMLHKLEMK